MDLVVIVMYALTSLVCSGILASSGAGHGHGALQVLISEFCSCSSDISLFMRTRLFSAR